MNYYTDMVSKHGFYDGDHVPPDAQEVRSVYIEVINALASRNGSAVRVSAWDRPGVHNPCMIRFQGLNSSTGASPDDAMNNAVYEAEDLNLDRLVVTTSRIQQEALRALLDTIG